MDNEKADKLAKLLKGEAWNSGGDIWLVIITRQDQHLVVISDEVICEYESQDDFDESNPMNSIFL